MDYIKTLLFFRGGVSTAGKVKTNLKNIYIYLSFGTISFLLGQAEIAPGFFTFFLIFTALAAGEKPLLLIFILTGGITGLTVNGNIYFLAYLTAPAIVIFSSLLGNETRKRGKIIFPLLISTSFLTMTLLINYSRDVLFYYYLLRLGESLAVFLFVFLYRELDLSGMQQREYYTVQEALILIVIAGGVLIGLSGFTGSNLPVNIFMLLFILGADLTTGTLLAAAMGIILVSAGIIPLIVTTKYILAALISGIMTGKSRWLIVSTLPLILLLYSGFSPSLYDLKLSVLELIAAGCLFLMIPDDYWKKIFNYYPSLQEPLSKKLDNVRNSAPEVKNQLRELAGVFTELSTTFGEVLPAKEEEIKTRRDNFIFLFRKRNCTRCLRQNKCWQEEKENTKRVIQLVLEKMQNENTDKNLLVKEFKKFCPFTRQITGGIKSCLELYQINNFWRNRLIGKQQIVSAQLAGISDIIRDFSSNSNLSIKKGPYLENIKRKIEKNHIKLYDLRGFSCQNRKKVHLELKIDSCSGNNPCQKQIKGILNGEFPYDFRLINRECGSRLRDKPCFLQYGPAGKHFLETAFIQKTAGDEICGDSFLYRRLIGGEDVIIISDGMGVGGKAALESKRAVRLFTSIVEAGFDQELAIKIINSALYLRNNKENFTTLDIAYFDTFSGRLLVYKTGAMPTFIKRGWKVESLQSSTLPAGILQELEIESKTFQLQKDDYIFMFSDGLFDVKDEEWFKQLIMSTSLENTDDYVNYIIEKMKLTGQVADDVTLLVFRVKN